MSAETHIHTLLSEVDEALHKAHAAVDDLKNAAEKVRNYYRSHPEEIAQAEQLAADEAKKVGGELGSGETTDEEQDNAGKQQENAKSK